MSGKAYVVPALRAVGTGGARGARAPPIFGRRNKIYLKFCVLAWFLSIVHPLVLRRLLRPWF